MESKDAVGNELKICVLVCVRQDPRLINCLRSLAEQDYPKDRYDVTVIDNNDTPEFEDCVKSFGFSYQLVRERGIGKARAQALHFLEGDVLANTDADCIPARDWLRKINDTFQATPNLGVLGGLVPKIEANSWIDKHQRSLAPNNQNEPQYLRHISDLPYVVGANAAYSYKALSECGGFIGEYASGSDVDVAWRIQYLGYKLVLNPDIIVHHACRSSIKGIFSQFARYSIGHVLLFKRHSKKRWIINWYPKSGMLSLFFLRLPVALFQLLTRKDDRLLGKCFFECVEYIGVQYGSIQGALRYRVLYL